MRMHPFLLAPLALAACQSPEGTPQADPVALSDAASIAGAVAYDYRMRYSPDACLDPVTIARNGPENIPHDLVNRTVTWTYLARSSNNTYEALDTATAKAIDDVWQSLHGGNYPSITLPAAALPAKPSTGCGKTLTLTSPMIAGTNAFVRWSDGTSRRTMALRKKGSSWSVVAEGPARIG